MERSFTVLCRLLPLLSAGLIAVLTRAETLTFIAQQRPSGLDSSWFSTPNWFRPGLNGLVPAGVVPSPADSVILQTDANAGANSIHVYSVTINGTATLNGGNFDLTLFEMLTPSHCVGSTLRVTGTFTTDGNTYLSGVTLTIDAGATAFISYNTPRTGGALVLNQNTLINNQGSFILNTNCLLSALGPCLFNNQANADLRGFDNSTVSGGAGDLVFDNRGSVRAEHGTLGLDNVRWNSSTGAGTFYAVVNNTTNLFRNSTMVISNGVTFAFKGPGAHRFTGGLQVDGAMNVGIVDPLTQNVDPGHVELALSLSSGGTGTLHVISRPAQTSTISWEKGHWGLGNLDIDAGGQLSLIGNGGNGQEYLDRGFINNSGNVALSGNAGFVMTSLAGFNNLPGGVFQLLSDAPVTGGFIDNRGLLIKANATGTTTVSSLLTNQASLRLETGSVTFNPGVVQLAGNTFIAAGQTLGASGNLFDLRGGSIFGGGSLNGRLSNAGDLSPGTSPGLFAITSGSSGTYSQALTGALNIELGGLNVNQFDRLTVSGAATLNGTLNVSLVNGFVPVAGNQFEIVRFASRAGTFAVKNGLRLANGLFLRPVYTTTNIALQTEDVTLLEPLLTATLVVLPTPQVRLSWPTLAAQPYQVEYSADLVQWFVLTSLTGNGGAALAIDPIAMNPPARFYRVR